MKRFAKMIMLALVLSVIPAKIWAQDEMSNANMTQKVQIREYENGFLFNVFTIDNVEERVQLASALATSDIWICNPTGNPGELFIRPNSYNADIPIYAEFDYLRMTLREEYEAASSLSKEEFTEVFNSWAHNISFDYYNFLISDHLDRANHCMDAEPFCTSDLYDFPAYNLDYSWSGPNYGCLGSSPTNKPSFWYYMRIGVAGDITILIEADFDVDFALWGPFNNQNEPCPTEAGQTGLLTATCESCPNNTSTSANYPYGNLHDCSFDARHFEYAHVVNGQVGQYYILLITNYSNTGGNITFQKFAGDGETDCGIMPGIVNNDGPYCEGETIHLTVNEQPNATYSWIGPNGFSSTLQNPIIPNCTMAMAGTYTCTTTVGAQNTTASTEVIIYQQATPSFTATTVCQGNPTQFNGIAGEGLVFHWDFGDDQEGNGQNPDHTYAQAGTYPVTLTVSNEDGSCPGEITQTVTVNAQPVADAGEDQSLPYPGLTATLNGSGGSDSYTYRWEPANMVVDPDSPSTQTVVLNETQDYELTVTNPQGQCISTDQVTVFIGTSALIVSVETPDPICENESAQLQVYASGASGNFRYSWAPTTGLSNPTIPNPIASPMQTTSYTCTITDNIAGYTRDINVTVTVNHPDYMEDIHVKDSCNSVHITWQGQDTIFYEDTQYKFIGETEEGCYREQTYHIENMKYSPSPSKIHPKDNSTVWSDFPDSNALDTAYVVTNTEFFSFQYIFRIEETYNRCVWDEDCHWTINKPSWVIEYDPTPKVDNGKYYSECTVYVAEHDDDPVALMVTVKNGCDSIQRTIYLKSSFLGVDENNGAAAKVSIVPNPNNGQMHINIEDMEGPTAIKVFDMTGNLIDAFETNICTSRYSYDYAMKQHAEGIYFFVFANNSQVFTKKVVIIQ